MPTIFDTLNQHQHVTENRKRCQSATSCTTKNSDQLDHGYCKKQCLIAPTVASSASASDDSTFQAESGSANVTQSAAADNQSCCEHAGLQKKVTALQKKVKQLQQQLRLERARHGNLVSGMKSFLNPDQIKFLRLGSKSKRTLCWSNKMSSRACRYSMHCSWQKRIFTSEEPWFPGSIISYTV